MEQKMRTLSLISTALLASVAFILLSMSVDPVASRPSIDNGWVQYHRKIGITDPKRMAVNECDASSQVRELCQRCAKATKSTLAYPMCCEGREKVREWCGELLMIG